MCPGPQNLAGLLHPVNLPGWDQSQKRTGFYERGHGRPEIPPPPPLSGPSAAGTWGSHRILHTLEEKERGAILEYGGPEERNAGAVRTHRVTRVPSA